jgi:hypothetical protein
MIGRGNARGSITLQVKSGILWVKITEDPKGEDLVACFREARQSRLLAGPMPTIVDMLDFNGTIDWGAIGTIREMISWERGEEREGKRKPRPADGRPTAVLSRCAYLSTDPLLAPVIKILCDLFGHTRHRQFRTPEQAMIWVLQSEAPPPETISSDDDF